MPVKALGGIVNDIVPTIKRFPLPVLFSLLFFLIITGSGPKDQGAAYLAICFSGCFWFIGVRLFAEARGWSRLREYALGIPFFAAMAWHLNHVPVWTGPFVYLGPALFLGMFIAAFVGRTASDRAIWQFNQTLWTRIGFTVIAAVILYLGILSIATALKYLFGIRFYSDLAEDLFSFTACIFSPLLAMTGIPTRNEEKECEYPKAVRFLLTYLLIPLLSIYFILLCIYMGKILLTWDWPKGNASSIASGFSCVGVVVWLMSYPIHHERGIIGWFGRHFFKALSVPIVLLGLSITMRLSQYGMTESRYAVLLLLIWLTGITLLTWTGRRDRMVRWMILSMVALLGLASFGPWGARHLSTYSQLHRLEAVLNENGLLKDGLVQVAGPDVSRDVRSRISESLDYFSGTRKLDYLRPWFSALPDAKIHQIALDPKLPSHRHRYVWANEVMADMGMEYIGSYDRRAHGRNGIRTELSARTDILEVTGYDYTVGLLHYAQGRPHSKPLVLGDITLTSTFDQAGLYQVGSSSDDMAVVDIVALWNELFPFTGKPGLESDYKEMHDKPLIVERETRDLKIRLVITGLYGRRDSDSGALKIASLNLNLLVKRR